MAYEYKKGSLILLAEGCYSDYQVGPMLRAIKDLDLKALAAEFIPNAPIKWERPNASASSFALWLTTNGWAEEVEYAEESVDNGYDFDLHKRTV